MVTWRDLGLERSQEGEAFSVLTIECPFCRGHGNFNRVFRGEAREALTNIEFFSDVWQCAGCANYIFVIWRSTEGHVDYRIYPYDKARPAAHPSWPQPIGHAYLQAMNALLADEWDSAVVLARHSIGLAAKQSGAPPGSLLETIALLRNQGKISEALLQWAIGMPQFSEKEKDATWSRATAKEMLRFTRYLLDTLYTLPHDSQAYRPGKAPWP